jgi:hypothetical protein
MKQEIFKNIALALLIITSLSSCTKSKPEFEFIADNETFSSFKSWTLEKTYNGPDPLLTTIAHLDNDNTIVRDVYFKDGQEAVEGEYPTGTLIVKNSYNPTFTVNEIVGIAKRGNGFNPQANDWEFFLLNADGSISELNGAPARGANLMNGICYGCHSSVSNRDFIFSK